MTKQQKENFHEWNRNLFELKRAVQWPIRSVLTRTWNARPNATMESEMYSRQLQEQLCSPKRRSLRSSVGFSNFYKQTYQNWTCTKKWIICINMLHSLVHKWHLSCMFASMDVVYCIGHWTYLEVFMDPVFWSLESTLIPQNRIWTEMSAERKKGKEKKDSKSYIGTTKWKEWRAAQWYYHYC